MGLRYLGGGVGQHGGVGTDEQVRAVAGNQPLGDSPRVIAEAAIVPPDDFDLSLASAHSQAAGVVDIVSPSADARQGLPAL